MKTGQIFLGAGLAMGLLAGCSTYKDPNYQKFELSQPAPASPLEAETVRQRLRSMDPAEEPSKKTFVDTLTPEEIATIQSYLNAHGYVAGLENGDFTARTDTAIRSYQRASGLEITGQPDEDLLYKAYAHFGDTVPYNPAREAFITGAGPEGEMWDQGRDREPTADSDWVTPEF